MADPRLADIMNVFYQSMIYMVPRALNPRCSLQMVEHIRVVMEALYLNVFVELARPNDSPLEEVTTAPEDMKVGLQRMETLLHDFVQVLREINEEYLDVPSAALEEHFGGFISPFLAELTLTFHDLLTHVPFPEDNRQYDMLIMCMRQVVFRYMDELQINSVPNQTDDRIKYLHECLRKIQDVVEILPQESYDQPI